LVAVDVDPAAGQRVGDVLGRDRAIELAALADLDAHRECRRRDAGRSDVGVRALALALVLAARDVVLPCAVGAARSRDGEALRDQEVRGVAIGHGLHLASLAELRDVRRQDHLHAIGSSFEIQLRTRGPTPMFSNASFACETIPGTRRSVLRTGPGVSGRTRAMSWSNATRSIPSSSSFSPRTSDGTPSRNRSTARTTTTRSSRPPRIGMSWGMRSPPMTR